MKLIIAGSRHLDNGHAWRCLCEAARFVYPAVREVVSGCAPGMDKLGERWAREMAHVPVQPFPADWDALGNAAGPVRNRAMAAYADFALVVWDGKSDGSADMLEAMRLAGKPALSWIVRAEPPLRLFP